MTTGSGSTSEDSTLEGCPREESGGHLSHERRAVRNTDDGEDTRHSRRNATTAAYSPFQSPGGGTGGGKTSIPATLWGERGPARKRKQGGKETNPFYLRNLGEEKDRKGAGEDTPETDRGTKKKEE
ncbi:hypothetical protein NDU88_002556 [Pleurodeles waltl]|uniref:Uncharacterized protein n=1 Tax=Pleurodeles waltl TaxID=8319 RepID=A0AAV7TKZ1_PLEWA|nr:hypothetical protein NDU88_002556 [Pleurodeles waltl]